MLFVRFAAACPVRRSVFASQWRGRLTLLRTFLIPVPILTIGREAMAVLDGLSRSMPISRLF
jgi:hypothetical protein